MMSERAEDKDGGERAKDFWKFEKRKELRIMRKRVEEEGGFLSSGKPTKEF